MIDMHGYLPRLAEQEVRRALARSPAVALLGPRQCGKSTMARRLLEGEDLHLDLQDRTDLNKLNEPELLFDRYRSRLICLDEIQRAPEIFTALRSEIDRDRRPGRFLILGSASRDLIRQSSETLAGRIAYLQLTGLLLPEIDPTPGGWQRLWLRGGFPESFLAGSEEDSFDWRQDFIRTFLERDIPSFGFAIPTRTMERLWRLLAHSHGQTLNYSKLAAAAELSIPTLKKYLGLLEDTYMVRLLRPFETNLKKRWVRSPKVYLRDSGILHALLDIETYEQLLGHPANGASWEGFALENVLAARPRHRPAFVRTSHGAEVDLLLERASERELFEFKLSKSPRPSRGFHLLMEELEPVRSWLVAPVDASYPFSREITVVPPAELFSA